jgi:hypothetical protein
MTSRGWLSDPAIVSDTGAEDGKWTVPPSLEHKYVVGSILSSELNRIGSNLISSCVVSCISDLTALPCLADLFGEPIASRPLANDQE